MIRKKNQRPYQICVSGAAAGETVATSAKLAFEVGREIAKSGHILLTGATIGLPYHAAMGAKDELGLSIGFSPADSYAEHVRSYRLPTDAFDFINYTGMDYVGRDVHLVRSSEAVITVGGRMGSLHEFSTAIESKKICGVLLGSGGLADFIPVLVDRLPTPGKRSIIYDTSPKRLVKRVIEALEKKHENKHEDLSARQVTNVDPQTNRRG